ncbi:MAG: hypothetical protein R2991_02740 [Thermoanaerobaculia bacterium]
MTRSSGPRPHSPADGRRRPLRTTEALLRRRPDWQSGRVVAERGRPLRLAWGATLLGTVLLVPSVAFVAYRIVTGTERFDARFVVLLAFAAVVLGFFGRKAYLSTRQAVRFGPATLRLEQTPVPLGNELRGTIEAPLTIAPHESVRIELRCTVVERRHVEGPDERIVWHETREVPADALSRVGESARIPLVLPLPAHPPATLDEDDTRVLWTVGATLVPDPRWRETFEIPVARSGASPSVEETPRPGSFREAVEHVTSELDAGRTAGPRTAELSSRRSDRRRNR